MNKKEKDKHYLPSCISTSSQKRLLKTGLFLWIPGRRKIKIESQHVHVKAMGKCQICHIIIYNTHTFRLIFSNNFTSALQKLSFFQRNFDSYAAAAAKSLQSCLTLCDPIDSSLPGSAVSGFSRQEYCSGLPFPSPMHVCMLSCFSHVRLCWLLYWKVIIKLSSFYHI